MADPLEIHGQTLLRNLPIPLAQITSTIVISNIDNDQLANALNTVNIEAYDIGTSNLIKNQKLQLLLSTTGVTVENVVELHRENKKAQFRAMFLTYLNSISNFMSHTSFQASQPVHMMAATIQNLASHVEQLPAQLAAMSLNASNSRYSKQPSTPIPKFDFEH